MKKNFLLLILVLISYSCATLYNSPYKNVTIVTSDESKIIYDGDTISTSENKAEISVERGPKPFTIIVENDSMSKQVDVKSQNSQIYWANIPFIYGFIFDYKNNKRYSYPRNVYIDTRNSNNTYSKYGQVKNKGEMYLHLSLPHMNSFLLTPQGESPKSSVGFWGLTIGLDYYHSDNQYLNAGVSGVSDFFLPVPAAIDMSGEYELMSSGYVSLSNNHKINRFSIGYGLSFGRNFWDFRYYDNFDPEPPTRDPVKKSGNAFGFVFPVYYQAGNTFNLGIVYRPTLYRPSMPEKFKYEHLISLDFAFKFRIKK